MRTAQLRRGNLPCLERGDIFLSWSTAPISRAIGWFQGRPGAQDAAEWSHTGVYLGGGMIAEATMPRGGTRELARYLGGRHRVHVYRMWQWNRERCDRFARIATALAERDYDVLNIARHMLDNLVERVTWDPRRREGKRPLAAMLKDRDGYGQNVCSELVEWANHFASSDLPIEYVVTMIHARKLVEFGPNGERIEKPARIPIQPEGEKMQPGRVGQARPMDVYHYLSAHGATPVLKVEFGRVTLHNALPREVR